MSLVENYYINKSKYNLFFMCNFFDAGIRIYLLKALKVFLGSFFPLKKHWTGFSSHLVIML